MSGPRFPDAKGRHVPFAIRVKILEERGNTCFYCGYHPVIALDHVVPWSQGGSHHPMNLVPVCSVCNSIAGERLFRDITDRLAYVQERRAVLERQGMNLRHMAQLPDGGGVE